MIDVNKIVDKVHFTGKKKLFIEQGPEDKQLIKYLDACINEGIKEQERETGKSLTITEGDRYKLRWMLIREILINKGMDPAELDELEAATTTAMNKAVEDHEKRVNSFKVIK